MNNLQDTIFPEQIESAFAKLETQINGQKNAIWHKTRQKALEQVRKLGFPSTKHEEWKYTNVKNLLNQNFDFQAVSQKNNKPVVQENIFGSEEAYWLTFVNGIFAPTLSTPAIEGKGLVISNLQNAYQNFADKINEHFDKYAHSETEAFTALNTALATDGAFVWIPNNTVLDKPLVLNYVTESSENNVFAQSRNLILVGKSAQVQIVEIYSGKGENQAFTNMVSEIVLAENSQVDHYKLQLDNDKASHIGTTQVSVLTDGKYWNTTVSLTGKLIRNNLNIVLNGENSEAFMNGLYAPKGSTHIDNHTVVDHAQPNCYSNELYKGILQEKATGVFNGKIFVRQYAQKTNAYQSNKNILLDETATMNTKPQLEIWADDVKCSHGCTIGALDEEPLFYLRARGIPERQARVLLLFAFVDDVLDRIKIEAVRKFAEQKIHEVIGQN